MPEAEPGEVKPRIKRPVYQEGRYLKVVDDEDGTHAVRTLFLENLPGPRMLRYHSAQGMPCCCGLTHTAAVAAFEAWEKLLAREDIMRKTRGA